MTSSSDSSSWYTFTAQSGPLQLMQHSHSTLTLKPPILFSPTLYLLPLYPHHRFMLLAVSLSPQLSLPFPNSLRVLQWNAGGLQVKSTKLLHFNSSHSVDLIYIQECNLKFLDSLLCDPMVLTPDLVFFLLMSQTLAAASSFLSSRAYSSLSFLPPLFLCLGPYSNYIEVNISLNDFSALSLLNVYAPPIGSSPKDSRTNFFSLSIFLSYVEAVDFSRLRFRFHRKSTASTASASSFRFHIPGFNHTVLLQSCLVKGFKSLAGIAKTKECYVKSCHAPSIRRYSVLKRFV